jgi:hypothetical protein
MLKNHQTLKKQKYRQTLKKPGWKNPQMLKKHQIYSS